MTTPQDPVAAPSYGAAPAYGSPEQGGYPPAPRTETLAVVALVCAIGSFLLPLILAIVALVLAGSSGREIKASGGRLTGAGLNTASRIIAWINIVLCVLVVVAVVGLRVQAGGSGGSEVGGY